MASRNWADLHTDLIPLYHAFDAQMKAEGIDYIVTCTYRSNAEQDVLYAQGRTAPGNVVTRARAGQSAHNITKEGTPAACAFDVVIMRSGKPIWGISDPDWQKLGAIGIGVGLEWAGTWQSFKEYPHFQLHNWKEFL